MHYCLSYFFIQNTTTYYTFISLQFEMDDKYQCHICMETAHKPIVTPCGHLFCWQCIYQWLRSNQEYLTCPLCKSGLELSSVRPILVKNQPPEKEELGVPPRPRPFAKIKQSGNWKQVPKSILAMGMNIQRGVLLAGYGIFPSAYLCLRQNFKEPQQREDIINESNLEYKIYRFMKIAVIVLIIIAIAAIWMA